MKSTMQSHPVLSSINAHRRDRHIKFTEEGHIYTITTDPNSTYTSVTTWNKTHFPKFDSDAVIYTMMNGNNWNETNKYWGLTAEEIKTQWKNKGISTAQSGTDLHFEIECFMNNPDIPSHYTHKELYEHYMKTVSEEELKQMSLEWQYFIQFVKDTPYLKPYRTEWLIFNEDYKLSGSIDMVYENTDETLSIYDWKRTHEITPINYYNQFSTTKCICHLPHSNFWHYTLQLNTYKTILEQKYRKKVRDLCLVKLHPDTHTRKYQVIPLPVLENDMEDLFQERKNLL
jgi:ATP-dependent exoDNAse (exonuclease V) beta subunit